MIGKLVILGAIVIVGVLIFMPGTSKVVTNFIYHEPTLKKTDTNPGPTTDNTKTTSGFGGTLVDDQNSQPAQTPNSNQPTDSQSKQTVVDNNQPNSNPTEKTTSTPPVNTPNNSPDSPPPLPTNTLTQINGIANLPSSISDFYTVIQLTSNHISNDVVLDYDDTSKKTQSVVVTIRNSDKEIFSATFTSSRFHATIEDFPNTPHIIEMTVQHSTYGTLHGSAFVPSSDQNTTISGVFTKS